jgi:hypothetical protein
MVAGFSYGNSQCLETDDESFGALDRGARETAPQEWGRRIGAAGIQSQHANRPPHWLAHAAVPSSEKRSKDACALTLAQHVRHATNGAAATASRPGPGTLSPRPGVSAPTRPPSQVPQRLAD